MSDIVLPARVNFRAGSVDVASLGPVEAGEEVRLVVTATVVEAWRKRDRWRAILEISTAETMEVS